MAAPGTITNKLPETPENISQEDRDRLLDMYAKHISEIIHNMLWDSINTPGNSAYFALRLHECLLGQQHKLYTAFKCCLPTLSPGHVEPHDWFIGTSVAFAKMSLNKCIGQALSDTLLSAPIMSVPDQAPIMSVCDFIPAVPHTTQAPVPAVSPTSGKLSPAARASLERARANRINN